MGVNPEEPGVYFVEDGEALKGLGFSWSTCSLASCQVPHSCLRHGQPSVEMAYCHHRGQTEGCLLPKATCPERKKNLKVPRPLANFNQGTHWTLMTAFHNDNGFLVYVICALHPPSTDQQ